MCGRLPVLKNFERDAACCVAHDDESSRTIAPGHCFLSIGAQRRHQTADLGGSPWAAQLRFFRSFAVLFSNAS